MENDSITAVQLIRDNKGTNFHVSSLINAIKGILSSQWSVIVKNVFRESNQAANQLVEHASEFLISCHWLERPPDGITEFLNQDTEGRKHISRGRFKMGTTMAADPNLRPAKPIWVYADRPLSLPFAFCWVGVQNFASIEKIFGSAAHIKLKKCQVCFSSIVFSRFRCL